MTRAGARLERHGLEKAYPQYAAQVWLYQAYLEVTEHPAIFTAVNGNTCARLHFLLPFNAEQAAAEQLDIEQTIRVTGLDPQPWDIGAIMAILMELADACPDIDWSQPLASWPREIMADFLLTAMRLIRKAMIARDLSGKGITRKSKTNDAASPL